MSPPSTSFLVIYYFSLQAACCLFDLHESHKQMLAKQFTAVSKISDFEGRWFFDHFPVSVFVRWKHPFNMQPYNFDSIRPISGLSPAGKSADAAAGFTDTYTINYYTCSQTSVSFYRQNNSLLSGVGLEGWKVHTRFPQDEEVTARGVTSTYESAVLLLYPHIRFRHDCRNSIKQDWNARKGLL